MTAVPSGPSTLRAFAPAVLWAIAIFCASSIPSNAMPRSIILSQDKLIHMGVYAVLGFVLYRGIRRGTTWMWDTAGWVTFGIGVLYGASDEFHQHFVPGRSMDIYDLLADAIGIVCAIGVARYLERRRSRPS
jgi:VanZ family protein